ncbi:MAG: rod shape-determining protein MreD [Clostridia bacterium]|nr:rod shape-determining protein MreD [Clostridia bacterium]
MSAATMARFAAALAVAVVLQTTVVPILRIGGVGPDLPLVLTVGTAVAFGTRRGFWVAVAAGVTLDLLGGRHVGTFLLVHLVAVALARLGTAFIQRDSRLLAALVAAAAGVCREVTLASSLRLAQVPLPDGAWWTAGLWRAGIDAGLAALTYPLFLRARRAMSTAVGEFLRFGA